MKRQFSIYTKNESNDELELIGYIFDDTHADIFDSLLQESKDDNTNTFYVRHKSFEPYEVYIRKEDCDYFKSILVPVIEPDKPNKDYMMNYINTQGKEYVYSICMEEPAELIQAISKCKRSMELNGTLTEKVIWNFSEELSDTLAVIEYVRLLYSNEFIQSVRDIYKIEEPRNYVKENLLEDRESMILCCIDLLGRFISYLATYPYYKDNWNPFSFIITNEIAISLKQHIIELSKLFGIEESYIKYWIQFKQNRGRYAITNVTVPSNTSQK